MVTFGFIQFSLNHALTNHRPNLAFVNIGDIFQRRVQFLSDLDVAGYIFLKHVYGDISISLESTKNKQYFITK